jgi:Icc protein
VLIAQLSDMHVAAPGAGLLQFVDGRERLAAALAHLAAMTSAPDVLLLTGDLVDHGTAAEYSLLRELLDPVDIPTYLIPGNHDDRAELATAFGHHAYFPRDGEPLAYAIDDFDVRLVGLDTLRDGYHDGELDAARLEWLDAQLAVAPDTPTVVFMHHPPFTTGIWWMDGNPMRGRDDFRTVIAAHPQVRRVIAGHVHHYASGQVGNVPCNTAPGVSYQAVLDLDPTASPKISNDSGPILLYQFTDDECVAHPVSYADAGSQILDFSDIVRDYPAFAARLRSGEGLTKDGFGM